MESGMALDRTAAALGEEVAKASEALVEVSSRSPERWWDARELKAEARNGWSPAATSLALGRLIEDGTFVAEKDKVRLSG
jgi:hypothetical protein